MQVICTLALHHPLTAVSHEVTLRTDAALVTLLLRSRAHIELHVQQLNMNMAFNFNSGGSKVRPGSVNQAVMTAGGNFLSFKVVRLDNYNVKKN